MSQAIPIWGGIDRHNHSSSCFMCYFKPFPDEFVPNRQSLPHSRINHCDTPYWCKTVAEAKA